MLVFLSSEADQMEPEIEARQRQGNIYQPRCLLEYGNISGRFWDFSAEWFKRRPGSQIVRSSDGLWKMPYLCRRASPEMSAAFDCLESFFSWHAEKTSCRNTAEEKKVITSVFPWVRCHRLSPSPPPAPKTRPNLLPSKTPTHSPNPSSLQFAAAHPLSSNPSRLRMRSRSHF